MADGADDAELAGLCQQRWSTGKDYVAAIKAYTSSLSKSAVVGKKSGGTFKSIRCLVASHAPVSLALDQSTPDTYYIVSKGMADGALGNYQQPKSVSPPFK